MDDNIERHKREAMRQRQRKHSQIWAEEFVPVRKKKYRGPRSMTPNEPRGIGDD